MEGKTRGTIGGEQQVGAERRMMARHRDRTATYPFPRRKMPPLVELAVVRQKYLRHHAEQLAAMDHEAAIVEPPFPAQWRPDHKHRQKLLAGGDQPLNLAGHGIEHRVLEQEIVDRIGREAQLREDHQRDSGLVALVHEIEYLVAVLRRLGDRDLRNANADPDELVAVGREKLGHRARCSRGRKLHLDVGNDSGEYKGVGSTVSSLKPPGQAR
jgi:hypothetical protein